MTAETVAGESLCKTFITAVLLTGSTQRAEAAILRGIASGNSPDLLARTLDSLLSWHAGDITDAPPSLPAELQCVLRLPAELRRCFVLRFLMEWPRERCAAALRVDVAEIDRTACQAAVQLAS